MLIRNCFMVGRWCFIVVCDMLWWHCFFTVVLINVLWQSDNSSCCLTQNWMFYRWSIMGIHARVGLSWGSRQLFHSWQLVVFHCQAVAVLCTQVDNVSCLVYLFCTRWPIPSWCHCSRIGQLPWPSLLLTADDVSQFISWSNKNLMAS